MGVRMGQSHARDLGAAAATSAETGATLLEKASLKWSRNMRSC